MRGGAGASGGPRRFTRPDAAEERRVEKREGLSQSEARVRRGKDPMGDKSPKKSGGKTPAAKTLKEKRAEKKAKAAAKKNA